MSEPASVFQLTELMRIAGSLILVAALVVFSGFVARRRMNRSTGRSLRVDERLTLARGVQLAIVAHEERRLLVGVSDKGVQLVADLGDDETPAAVTAAEPSAEPSAAIEKTEASAVNEVSGKLTPAPARGVSFAERLAERLVAHVPGAGRGA